MSIKKSKFCNGTHAYANKFKRFNIFTRNGENRTVTAPYPMTLDEAMHYFNALSIGGGE